MGEASGRSIKILSTRSPLFPNSLESASVANFRVLKEIISFHPVRAHHLCNHAPRRGTSYEIAIHLHREETQVEGESGEKPSGFHKANEVSWNDDHSRNSCYISSFSKPSHEQGFGTYPKKQLPLHRTEH